MVWAQHDNLLILQECKHTDALKIDDIKPVVEISCVCIRHVHNSLQIHTCMSAMHMQNLDYMHANSKPKTAE